MTSYRRINSRALNKVVRQQDNMVNFMKPISQATYPTYFSVPDASNNSLLVSTGSTNSASASSKLTFDGTTLNVTGSILPTQFLPGQVVNVKMLGYTQTDLSQNTIDISSNPTISTQTIFTYTYTPKIANSYILCEYQTKYTVAGGGSDTVWAYLYINGIDRSGETRQTWNNTSGGGTRSGTIFPIVGRYTNTDVTGLAIRVDVYNGTDADNLTVYGDIGTWLKITEIGR